LPVRILAAKIPAMQTKFPILLLCVVYFLLTEARTVAGTVSAKDPNTALGPPEAKAAVISCTGLIDDGLYSSIKRRANMALELGASYLILEIGTYGGLVQSADDISKYLILELSQKAKTVAYINTEAISAGAMISVSCQDIIMRKNTTIGDCAPIQMGEKLEGVEREKAESFIRAVFQRAAEANKYPPALLEAMVSKHKKVWRIKNIKTNLYEFCEDEKLPTDARLYDLQAKELIDSENEILTLTAARAKEYGIARSEVNDVNEAIAFLAQRDNVKLSPKIIRLEPNWSEQLVRMLNHPTVSGILFMIAMLAVYIELKAPGIGLPGLVAVICFAILFGSRFLTGLATWWEIAVFAMGIILLSLEIFVIPGFGIAGVLGILFILLSLFAILVPNRPDELPWPRYDFNDVQWQLLSNGAWGFSLGFAGFIILAYILAKFLPKTGPLTGLVLAPADKGPVMEIDSTAPPEKTGKLKTGTTGVAITKLRPAGQGRFGDSVVDVVAEGDFVEKDKKIKIIQIEGNRVVVRQITD
jgi:membrane-bound serine protease (ClpP class)